MNAPVLALLPLSDSSLTPKEKRGKLNDYLQLLSHQILENRKAAEEDFHNTKTADAQKIIIPIEDSIRLSIEKACDKIRASTTLCTLLQFDPKTQPTNDDINRSVNALFDTSTQKANEDLWPDNEHLLSILKTLFTLDKNFIVGFPSAPPQDTLLNRLNLLLSFESILEASLNPTPSAPPIPNNPTRKEPIDNQPGPTRSFLLSSFIGGLFAAPRAPSIPIARPVNGHDGLLTVAAVTTAPPLVEARVIDPNPNHSTWLQRLFSPWTSLTPKAQKVNEENNNSTHIL